MTFIPLNFFFPFSFCCFLTVGLFVLRKKKKNSPFPLWLHRPLYHFTKLQTVNLLENYFFLCFLSMITAWSREERHSFSYYDLSIGFFSFFLSCRSRRNKRCGNMFPSTVGFITNPPHFQLV